MRLIRSWPARVPRNRAHVVDNLPKLIMDGWDYAPIVDVNDEGVILLEWDIAIDREGLERFTAAAQADPEHVRVAPFRIYQTTAHSYPIKPHWAHRRADGTRVEEGEPTCTLFAFGMIYFPPGITRRYLDEVPGHFSDGSFSGWHHNNVAPEVPIMWDVRPVHLHY